MDDKLELLKGKLRKEGESNFTNTQSENDSVRRRIVLILDDAGRALLVKSATCTPSVLEAFYEVATAKMALMAKYKCAPYDAEGDLHSLVINRLNDMAKEGNAQ